ncbi:MAG TPA: hypothetical protein VN903_35460, partial [Polyangia bacterium]|nr:hypothetical protein [Polyangia bacterium]
LPAGSQLLVIGERGRAVGVRLADGQQAVLDTLSGRELWRGAADGAAPTLAGGDRFVVTQGRQGIALQSLDGGVAAQVEPARRSDWDLTALSDVQRYSAIIDAAVSDDGAVLVTAWNDGRIDVWRPGLKPRYGAIDAVPRPNFESMARFDHGEALGATATWNAPVPLTLSPSGRFVASQSLGVATNAVGGVVAFTPKLRVWDARTGGEIARFARERPMLIAFSPRDDLAVTMTRRAAPNERETLELWRLGAEGPAVAREEISVPVPAASQGRPDARPGGAPSPADLLAAQSGSSDRVWLGVDGKLRAIDRQQRKVVVLDDLVPAFDESRTRAKQAVANLVARQDVTDEERAALRGVPGMIDKLPGPAGVGIPGLPLRHSASVDVPALPLPFTAVAVSGDGRRAVVKIGAQLRVYVLEGQRLASTIDCGDGSDLLGVVDISGELARQAPVLSYDGRFVAVSRIDTLELLRAVWNMKTRPSEPGTVRRDITVTALEGDHPSATPIARVPAYIQVGPLMTPLGAVFTASRALALSADGKLLALERRELVATANRPPRREARLTVIETRTGQLRLAAAPAPLPSPIDLDAQTAAIPWAAAFSPSGRRLVGEETRSPCPLRLVTNPRTWMPMNVPSCPQLATRLTWWDLDGASMLGSVSYERAVRSSQASKGALPRRGAALAMPNEKDVERSVVEWAEAPACDTPPCVSVHWTEERISLDRRDRLVEEACERLPPALRVLPEADWHQRLPGETPRAICAASVPQSR